MFQDILTNPIIIIFFAISGVIITATAYLVAVRTYGYFIRETNKNSPMLNKNLKQGLYDRKTIKFWAHTHRKKASELVDKIPPLAARPKLLAHITDIIKGSGNIETSCQLYEVMIEAWLDRESDRVDKKALRTFCELLAVDLFVNGKRRGQERATKAKLLQLARQCKVSLEGLELRKESLLHRDTNGYYKFAHRSIMEFLFVKRWLKGDNPVRQVVLTDQMGKFLAEMNLCEIDLVGANLSKTDLSGADFRGVNLSDAYLSESNLLGANLLGADLSGADLSRTILSGGNLRRVDLTGVYLRRADVSKADLWGANLSGADLRWADLSGADLRETNLCGANLQKTKIDNATQIYAKWRLVWEIINHKIEDRNFFRADLSGANLKGVNLSGANLYRADLRGTNLCGTNLIGANLKRADLRRTDLRKTSVSGANYSWMDLSGTNFRKANLCGVDLRGLDLRGMDFSYANLSRANLIQADLRKADLSGVNLSKANLCRADLRGANLSGTDLCETNLSGANLHETNLDEAKHDYATKMPKNFSLRVPEVVEP
jgi:uncharacterized protein YjbI with pentapeptide repeats